MLQECAMPYQTPLYEGTIAYTQRADGSWEYREITPGPQITRATSAQRSRSAGALAQGDGAAASRK